MESFGLLLGHMVGDYIVQNDWMAANKTNLVRGWRGYLACTVHCLCYTLAVLAFSYWWMPLWGLVACFALHWPVDRFRLARWWMEHVAGQKAFAAGALSPWSVIVVDNTFHLAVLFVIGWLSLGR